MTARARRGKFSIGVRFEDDRKRIEDWVAVGDIKTITGIEVFDFVGAIVEPEAALMILARKMARDTIKAVLALPE